MALLDGKRKPNEAIPTSSMADVAFLLLVFFLVTTVFPKDKGLALVLPEPESYTEVSQGNIMHLVVLESGTVRVQLGENPQSQFMTPNEVEAVWRMAIARNPQLIAAIKPEARAEYGHMIAVLDALQSAGAERISLQMLESES